MVSVKEVYDVGEIPPVGEVPPLTHAQGDPAGTLRGADQGVPDSRGSLAVGPRAWRRATLALTEPFQIRCRPSESVAFVKSVRIDARAVRCQLDMR